MVETTVGEQTERLFPDSGVAGISSPFRIDLDRLRLAPALLRLIGVTQVVDPREGRRFHSRYIHTLRVAQVGRNLAEVLLSREQSCALIEEDGGLEPAVVEAAGLAHDLGHPPFGHVGEHELDRLVRDHGNADGFEGNAQSFRIVTRLAVMEHHFLGLNLTRRSLNAILKYPWFRGDTGPKARKFSVYSDDSTAFQFARHGSLNEHLSIEARLMDLADEIVYSLHDVMDFYQARIIPLPLLSASADERRRVLDTFRQHSAHAADIDADDIFANMLSMLSPGAEYSGTRAEIVLLTRIVSEFTKFFVNSVVCSADGSHVSVALDARASLSLALLKHLTRYYVIDRRPLGTQQEGYRRVLRVLFDAHWEAIEQNRWRSVLPPYYQEYASGVLLSSVHSGVKQQAVHARIVADLIAGLTDAEAVQLFRRLSGIEIGRVTDLVPE